MQSSRIVLLTVLAITSLVTSKAESQVVIGGLLDLEIRKGGSDSAPFINQTPTDKLTIYTPTVRLFADASLTDRWFVQAALQADYYEGTSLSPAFFSVINLNWLPYSDSDFMVTAGRFVTPYGRYSHRVLSADNPFIHLPLSHAWNLPVDKKRGYYAGDPGDLDYDDVLGQSMVYQRMYTQGVMISNFVQEGRVRYDLAATLSSASSHFETGMHNVPAVTGRLEFMPVIWADLGLSFSYGPYMKRDEINENLTDTELRSYTQTLFGADVSFSYHYYTLSLDVNYNRWKTPYIADNGQVLNDNLIADAFHATSELHIRLPFLPGAYTSFLFDLIRPEELSSGSYNAIGFDPVWAPDINRLEWATGYHINRNVTCKLSWLTSTMPGSDQQLKDGVVAFQLSALF